MKRIIPFLTALLLIQGVAFAAPKSIEERVNTELAIYTEVLALSEPQAEAIRLGLTDKLTVGREAYEIKKAGDEAKGKELNQAAGKEFYNVLKSQLSKEQFNTYKMKKAEIKDAIKSSR